jgi:hypothetical protein
MAASITAGQWNAVRSALRDTGERFAEMVRSCDAHAMATRDWSVADTVAHVTSIALWDTALAHPGGSAVPYPWNAVADLIRVTTVDTVNVLNDAVMKHFTERDCRNLAMQLSAHIDEMLRVSAGLDPNTPVNWLGESRIPLAGAFAHLTNELQIHGRDIARATGSGWVTPPTYAAQFLEVFVVGITRHGVGRLLYRDGVAGNHRIAVEFRPRHSARVILSLAEGAVTVGEPGSAVDVCVRFDPVVLNLMLFGRVSPLRAVLSGKVVVTGSRPWLLPAFLRTVRFPS